MDDPHAGRVGEWSRGYFRQVFGRDADRTSMTDRHVLAWLITALHDVAAGPPCPAPDEVPIGEWERHAGGAAGPTGDEPEMCR
jgi:hypothetical protein